MFLSNRGSFRPETSGAYTLRRRGRRRPKSGSAIGACAVARLAGSGGPIGDYYGSANINQQVLARFMTDGSWDRHLRRVQAKNRRKYETLTRVLSATMGNDVEMLENGTGLHLLVRVRDGRPQDELVRRAAEADVAVYPTKKYWSDPARHVSSTVLVGFSSIAEDDIEPGIRALAGAWFG